MASSIMLYRHDGFDDIVKEVAYLLGDFAYQYDLSGIVGEFGRAIDAQLVRRTGAAIRFCPEKYFVINDWDATEYSLAIIDAAIDAAIEWVERNRIVEKYHACHRFM